MARKSRTFIQRRVLMGQVWASLGSGKITETFIRDDPRVQCDGCMDEASKHIHVNIVHEELLDTITHELLHRIKPSWSERYVRRMTTVLLREMTDEERVAFLEEYRRVVKRRKRPLDVRGETQ